MATPCGGAKNRFADSGKSREPFAALARLFTQTQTMNAVTAAEIEEAGTMMILWSSLANERDCEGSFAGQPANTTPSRPLRL